MDTTPKVCVRVCWLTLTSCIVEPIVGHQYLELLRQEEPKLVWHEEAEESYFTYQDARKKVFYPSMRFLARRLELAAEAFGGIAIWELGQGMVCLCGLVVTESHPSRLGLDMFYDVL